MDARRGSWLGEIHLVTPLSRWMLAVMAAAMGVAIVLFMVYGHYTKRDRVSGELVPSSGLLNVTSATGGVVTAVDVREGQHVRRGDPLVEMSGDTDSASLGDIRARISARLRAQQHALEADVRTQTATVEQQRRQLKDALAMLESQKAQVVAQEAIQQEQVGSDQTLLRRIEPLESKGYVSAFQVQQQHNALLQAKTQLKSLTRQRLQIAQQMADTRHKLAQLPLTLSSQRSATERQIDGIAQQLAQNEAQRASVLRARSDGVVSSLLVKPGQSVRGGQPLLSVLPRGSALQAQLLVPSRAVGFIDPGSRVVLRYQAYPYQKFGLHYGRVSSISRSALGPSDIVALTGRQAKQPLYEITVDLDRQSILAYGKAQPLKPGMSLSADILMDRRTLLEWVFEPLYGLRRGLFDGDKAHG